MKKTIANFDGIRRRQIKKDNQEIALQLILGIGTVIITILVIDATCFMAWVISGQSPVDGFYFGAITANIISLF